MTASSGSICRGAPDAPAAVLQAARAVGPTIRWWVSAGHPTVSCVDDKDRALYAELLRVLGEVDGWVARMDSAADRPQRQSGSPLRADDDRLHPYELSHAAWHSLIHAVDHLNCLQTVLRDAGLIHMFAPYSLVRSALENACAAVWMLHPPSRPERVARRLRFAAEDIRNGENVKELIGETGPRSKQERMDQVHDVAKRAGVNEATAARRRRGRIRPEGVPGPRGRSREVGPRQQKLRLPGQPVAAPITPGGPASPIARLTSGAVVKAARQRIRSVLHVLRQGLPGPAHLDTYHDLREPVA